MQALNMSKRNAIKMRGSQQNESILNSEPTEWDIIYSCYPHRTTQGRAGYTRLPVDQALPIRVFSL